MIITIKILISLGIATLTFLSGLVLAWILDGGLKRAIKNYLIRRQFRGVPKVPKLEIPIVHLPAESGEVKSTPQSKPAIPKSLAVTGRDYVKKFMTRRLSHYDRTTIELDSKLYFKIRYYLHFIALGLSHSSYITNIIEDHIEENKSGITEAINNKIEEILE